MGKALKSIMKYIMQYDVSYLKQKKYIHITTFLFLLAWRLVMGKGIIHICGGHES